MTLHSECYPAYLRSASSGLYANHCTPINHLAIICIHLNIEDQKQPKDHIIAVTYLSDKIINVLFSITQGKTKRFITADRPMTELAKRRGASRDIAGVAA